VLVLYCKTVNL